MAAKTWPLVKQRKNPGGSITWMVDCGMVGTRRERYFLKTKQEADTKAAQLRIAKKNEGIAVFSIPEKLRVEALECADLLVSCQVNSFNKKEG